MLLTLGIGAVPASAQVEEIQDQAEQAESVRSGEGAGEFVVAPIPIVNPSIGTGLAAIAMYLFQIDEGSQVSFTGVGGLYSASDSWAVGVGQVARFKKDSWRIKGGATLFDMNLEFYGIGSEAGDRGFSIRINQAGWGAVVQGLRRIKGQWYGGLQYWYVNIDSTFHLPELPPDFPLEIPSTIEWDSTVTGLGLAFEYDSRDNQFNAYSGGLLKAIWNVADETIGSDFDFERVDVSYNRYIQIDESRVLAARVAGCAAPGDAPYYALCKFGQGNDLRGYVGGRYRDEIMLAVQAEYRWHFYKRFGMVAFAGVGQVTESLGDFATDDLLPSVGAGLRFLLSPDNRLNLSMDWAVGKDDNHFYFYVGESF